MLMCRKWLNINYVLDSILFDTRVPLNQNPSAHFFDPKNSGDPGSPSGGSQSRPGSPTGTFNPYANVGHSASGSESDSSWSPSSDSDSDSDDSQTTTICTPGSSQGFFNSQASSCRSPISPFNLQLNVTNIQDFEICQFINRTAAGTQGTYCWFECK